jgi:hypothetical protein
MAGVAVVDPVLVQVVVLVVAIVLVLETLVNAAEAKIVERIEIAPSDARDSSAVVGTVSVEIVDTVEIVAPIAVVSVVMLALDSLVGSHKVEAPVYAGVASLETDALAE